MSELLERFYLESNRGFSKYTRANRKTGENPWCKECEIFLRVPAISTDCIIILGLIGKVYATEKM